MSEPATKSAAGGVVRGADVTTFALGGPLRRFHDFAEPAAARDVLREADAAGAPWRVIGGGSNLLISDAGLDEIVVRLWSPSATPVCEGDEICVSGAMELDALARWAVEEGWDGLLFATGIPGTVGGAVVGNAGAYGEQIADRLVSLQLFHPRRGARTVPRDAISFAYRRSSLQTAAEVVESVRLRLWRGDRARLRDERERILAWRRERHPDWRTLPTAGSFFRNIEPTSAAERRHAAGWFLEQAGAKGLRVGGAAVYEKHANIIVKRAPECTAADVLELARRMADAVRRKFGLTLSPEVRVWGAFAGAPLAPGDCDLSAGGAV